MKVCCLRIGLLLGLSSAIVVLAVPQLVTYGSASCSWDYLIWMPRSKNADPIYRFVQNGKAGYIDQTGKIVIPPTLDTYGNAGGEFHDGMLQIDGNSTYHVDRTGAPVKDDGLYRHEFSEGLALAKQKGGKKWGYIDGLGRFVISPRFDSYPLGSVSSFSDGLAMIQVAGKYGYIDRTGEFVIQPQFLLGNSFHEGRSLVVVEGPCTYYGGGICAGSEILGESDSKEGLPTCKVTFIDKSGAVITTERFDQAYDFSEGFASIRIGSKWGFIDQSGNVVIKPKFEAAYRFSEGLALVKDGGLFGYIDVKGAYVIQPQFKYAGEFNDGLAVVGGELNEKKFDYNDYYYINNQGHQAIQERFVLASHFFKGLAHVKLRSDKNAANSNNYSEKGMFAYINTSGIMIFTYWGEG